MKNIKTTKGKFKLKHYINYISIALVMIIFCPLAFSGNLAKSGQALLVQISIAMILAVSLSLVVGSLGELSLGHAGFMCVGAYLGGKIASLLVPAMGGDRNSILVLIISVLVATVVSGIFGLIIGIPALRLKGDYLAIVTLAFGEIVRTLFMNSSETSFGGTLGLRTPKMNYDLLFTVGFVFVLITLFIMQNLLRSKHGRAISAIRDNEIAARATGINVTKYKLIAFALSASFAGIAGVLYSYSQFTIQSNTFGYNYSIDILVMVVLGGMSITGSLISATVITFLKVQLATTLTGNLAVLQNFVFAVVLIGIVIYNNAPKLKPFREKFNFRVLINKIMSHKKDASHVNDDILRWDVVPTKISTDELLSVDTKVNTYVQDKPDKPQGGSK